MTAYPSWQQKKPPPIPAVGERITRVDDLDLLPLYSQVVHREAPAVRFKDGWYFNGQPVSRGRLVRDCALVRLGTGGFEDQPGLSEYKQRLSTISLGSARRYDRSIEAANRFLAGLGCTNEDSASEPLRLGMWVNAQDTWLIDQLPWGTLLQHGHPERDDYMLASKSVTGLAIYMRPNQEGAARNFQCWEVVSFPPSAEIEGWFDMKVPMFTRRDRLEGFKRRAWMWGWAMKLEQDWCSSYETVLDRLALDSSVVGSTVFPGDTVTDRQELTDAAVGSVVGYESEIWTKRPRDLWQRTAAEDQPTRPTDEFPVDQNLWWRSYMPTA